MNDKGYGRLVASVLLPVPLNKTQARRPVHTYRITEDIIYISMYIYICIYYIYIKK